MSVCLLGSNLQNKAHHARIVFELLLKYWNMNLSAGETDPKAKKAFDLFKFLIFCSFPHLSQQSDVETFDITATWNDQNAAIDQIFTSSSN